jgi:DNA invertase Pin-like site-specific DNA recombinase
MAENSITQMKAPKAVAYYRVSSPKQDTIDTQKSRIKKFAHEKGYDIIEHFEDDGISGESIDKRPHFQSCLNYITENRPAFLLVFMVDRIGRFKARADRNRVIELLERSNTSVDSPYDGLFLYDKEEDLNDLEKLLNESRRDNKRRGIRVHEGHANRRLNGGWSGGRLPHGIGYSKEQGFFVIEEEQAALKEIFEKTANEHWGVIPLIRYLNADLAKFPKREPKALPHRRKNKRKPLQWTPTGVSHIIYSDFYFTGKIQPTKANQEKGLLGVDTKIKLFDESLVKQARRERATKRWRDIDENRKNRKVTHGQIGAIAFTDYLLHGIARCGHCGWFLGKAPTQYRKNNKVYHYYRCNKRRTRGPETCQLRSINASKLDKIVWEKFAKQLTDPTAAKKRILQGDFLSDHDQKARQALLRKAEEKLIKFDEALAKAQKLFQWGDYTATKYQQEKLDIERQKETKRVEIAKLKASLQRPKEVEAAVKEAARHVADQLRSIIMLERQEARLSELITKSKAAGKGSKYKIATLADMINETKRLLKDWDKPEFDDSPAGFEKAVRELIFKQKRNLLHEFIDFDEAKGIRIFDKDNVELNFSLKIPSNSSLSFNEMVKTIAHSQIDSK